ncbi:hypothetical protein RJG79_01840 [Mycoplasmatota bacterium WC44]
MERYKKFIVTISLFILIFILVYDYKTYVLIDDYAEKIGAESFIKTNTPFSHEDYGHSIFDTTATRRIIFVGENGGDIYQGHSEYVHLNIKVQNRYDAVQSVLAYQFLFVVAGLVIAVFKKYNIVGLLLTLMYVGFMFFGVPFGYKLINILFYAIGLVSFMLIWKSPYVDYNGSIFTTFKKEEQ